MMTNPHDAIYAASCEPMGSPRYLLAEAICCLRGVDPYRLVQNGFGQTWEQWRSVLAELMMTAGAVIHN